MVAEINSHEALGLVLGLHHVNEGYLLLAAGRAMSNLEIKRPRHKLQALGL